MRNSKFMYVKVLGDSICEYKMKILINYFRACECDLIQFDDDYNLDLKISKEMTKSIIMYEFIQDLEYLVKSKLNIIFHEGVMRIRFNMKEVY